MEIPDANVYLISGTYAKLSGKVGADPRLDGAFPTAEFDGKAFQRAREGNTCDRPSAQEMPAQTLGG